jgi:flagellar basal body rod protein FlgG
MELQGVALLGLQADEARLKAISQNIANVLTPGYKAQVPVTASFVRQLDSVGRADADTRPVGSSAIDPRSGNLRYTGNLDEVAVEGDAFLELAGPGGPVYTRQGSLRVDVRGRLVGTQGLPVVGTSGEIALANAPFSVSALGEVSQGGRVVGTLRLVAFDHPSRLESLGNGMYAQGAAQVDERASGARVRPGFSEASNVSSAQEMVRLSETVRHYEALHKVVQGYDESLEKAIRKLGEF